MAVRRKKVDDSGASLDSLMDALTNVVAVLIFVLLLVNCEVSQKIVEMMADIVPVSQEDMDKVKKLLEQIELDKQKLEELLKKPAPTQIEIDQLKQQISAIQALIQNRKSEIDLNQKSLEELRKLHDQTLAERDTEKTKTDTMVAEIQRLEGLLDTTPVPEDIPPTEITIPAVRPIPEGARLHYAFIRGNRAHLVDPDAIEETIAEKLKSKKKELVLPDETAPPKGARPAGRRNEKEETAFYDREKLLAFLESIDLGLPEGIKVKFVANAWDPVVQLFIEFNNEAGGTNLEQLELPGANNFSTALGKLRPPKDVVLFRVFPDSLLTYAKARELVEKRNIPCGWEMTGETEAGKRPKFQHMIIRHLAGVQLKPTAQPPVRTQKPGESARDTGPKLD